MEPFLNAALRRWMMALGAAVFAALAGCATVQSPDPRDPWESFNRSVFEFNEGVDKAVLKPVATAYVDVVPTMMRTGVGNFFGNMADAWSFVNNVLQAKPEAALSSFWRVAINSTVGLGGVLDPASEMRLEKYREDFGQTLGYWGVPSGPYLVLPILGSFTLRDSLALPVDWYGYPLSHVNSDAWMYGLTVLGIVDVRARLLDASDLAEAAAIDPYTFRREAYLQRRANRVGGGSSATEERYDLDPPPTAPIAAPSRIRIR
jgi:phospholipid-binding lipoprotein MlaA